MTKTITQLKQIKSSFKDLDDRKQTIVIERLQGRSLGRVGKRVDLSGARVGQLEKEAWDQLIAS